MPPAKHESWIYPLARKYRAVLPHGLLANLWQWRLRYLHDPDFEIFEWLSEIDGLVLDAGASRGQSALSVLRNTRRMRVFSVEPNRKWRWSLLLICLLHPWRYRFRLVAADAERGDKPMYIPGRRASGLSAQASLDPTEFDKDYVRERLAESGFDATANSDYRVMTVHTMPLDDLGLAPDMIKLDVEGFEHQALAGLENTLRKHHPALMIEINNIERWFLFLQTLGYGFYFYDSLQKSFQYYDKQPHVLNLFCLHKSSKSNLTAILLAKVKE